MKTVIIPLVAEDRSAIVAARNKTNEIIVFLALASTEKPFFAGSSDMD